MLCVVRRLCRGLSLSHRRRGRQERAHRPRPQRSLCNRCSRGSSVRSAGDREAGLLPRGRVRVSDCTSDCGDRDTVPRSPVPRRRDRAPPAGAGRRVLGDRGCGDGHSGVGDADQPGGDGGDTAGDGLERGAAGEDRQRVTGPLMGSSLCPMLRAAAASVPVAVTGACGAGARAVALATLRGAAVCVVRV